jgi:hypothetical protein
MLNSFEMIRFVVMEAGEIWRKDGLEDISIHERIILK